MGCDCQGDPSDFFQITSISFCVCTLESFKNRKTGLLLCSVFLPTYRIRGKTFNLPILHVPLLHLATTCRMLRWALAEFPP